MNKPQLEIGNWRSAIYWLSAVPSSGLFDY
jgi:hypothetical protein